MWRLYVFYGVVARCCVVYNFTPRRADIKRKLGNKFYKILKINFLKISRVSDNHKTIIRLKGGNNTNRGLSGAKPTETAATRQPHERRNYKEVSPSRKNEMQIS